MRRHGWVWRLIAYLAAIPVVLYVLWWAFVYVLAILHPPPPITVTLSIDGVCDPRMWPNELRIMSWNLGYAGTGSEADFFMDGGHEVLAMDKPTVYKHLGNFISFLNQHPEDIYLFQEVDSGSRRTYYINELENISNGLPAACRSYALNHNVSFVPVPRLHPLGRVRSGLLSFAEYRPAEAKRLQLPGSFPWPDSAFTMERCLLVWRLPREDGNEWVVINTHLEAWDQGDIRSQELKFLKDLAIREYAQGHYVVIGGDWNSVLPGVRMDQFPSKDGPNPYTRLLPEDWLPKDWTWGVDRSRPSNRRTNVPYLPGRNYRTVIDGFVVSPNVEVKSVATLDLNFEDSDHEPAVVQVASR